MASELPSISRTEVQAKAVADAVAVFHQIQVFSLMRREKYPFWLAYMGNQGASQHSAGLCIWDSETDAALIAFYTDRASQQGIANWRDR